MTQSKRRMERNKTLYKLSNNLLQSREMPDEKTVESFLKAIYNNSQSKFGIKQLAKFNLNGIYNEKTILEIACEKNRDFIAFNLFRGGADPTVSLQNPVGLKNAVKVIEFLRSKWPAFACFSIKLVNDLRKRMVKYKCSLCNLANFVFTLGCSHRVCESCFWDLIILKVKFDDPVCSKCAVPLISANNEESCTRISSAESKKIFDEMPENMNNSDRKKYRFEALPMLALNGMYLGATKRQRIDVFFKCCETGNASKLRHVIAEGIDINLRNEYGQTGLFVAVWKQNISVIKLLREYNADQSIPDNSGTHISKDLLLPLESDFEPIVGTVNHLECAIDQAAFLIDGGFSDNFLKALELLLEKLPVAEAKKLACSDRLYFSDSTEWVSKSICRNMKTNLGKHMNPIVFPDMRFLCYKAKGGYLPPHIDLSRTNDDNQTSTHTFIVYLRDVANGGETNLLDHVPPIGVEGISLCSVKPKRGRLLCFPHISPHEGRVVIDVPKILLRGEIKI